MLTVLGKKLRNHRIDKGITLKDLAASLGFTSSYLSALEIGKKNMPIGLLDRIGEYLHLSKIEIEELKQLAEQSKKINYVDVSGLSRDDSQLIAAFVRKFDELSLNEKEKIKEMVN